MVKGFHKGFAAGRQFVYLTRHAIFFNEQEPVPERRNNSIPGINVPYFRDNFIPIINSVPERRNNATKGINLG